MSELLKMYKTLKDKELGERVQGAVIKQANYYIDMNEADPKRLAFARLVKADPFRQWQDFHMEVASNGTVLAQVTLSKDNEVVYTHDVKDSDIEYVVGVSWDKIAAKYTDAPEDPPA